MRYFFLTSILWVFLCVTIIDLPAQDKKNNQTLLWRIQKEGIEKPSFLFGTMHIYDKKAFNFQDSLYFYLEQAEAFALELNPDSANQVIAAYMNGELNNDEKDDWSAHVAARDMEKMKKIADKDEKADVVKNDRSGLIGYFVNRLINTERKQKESMNTYMDAFLYEMAWQNGKKIFGLEELEGKGEVLKALSKGLKGKKLNNLLDKWDPSLDGSPVHRLYLKEDIDSIDLFFNDFFTESALDIVLFDRNQVMANRMDSIMQAQTLFAAVGTAHLPGEKGVIELLRRKGYVVEPVFSKKRISAEEYQFKKVKRDWQLIKNEGYGFQYQLPGVSKTQEAVQGRKIVYHYDIGGGSIFMTIYGKLSAAERKKNINDIITGHLDGMMQEAGGTVLSKKAIVYEGLKGMEALCLYNDNSYYKYREVVKDNIFYILSVGAKKKDNLSTEKAEQYFKSFKLVPIPKANWTPFLTPGDGFSVLLPGKPIVESQPLDKESAATISANIYSWFDANSGVSYSITSGKALAGNQYLEGDYFFQNYVDHIKSLAPEEPVIEDTLINGYAGKKFITKSPVDRVKGFIVKRANTSYFVTVEYEPGNEADAAVDKFLRSFQMTSFAQPVWSSQLSPDKNFTAWLPGQIKKKEQDSTAYDFNADEVQYFGHDPFASVSYNVEVYPINKYYWAPNIDSIYNYWKGKVMNAWSDSLLSLSVVNNGGLAGREICFVNKTSKTKTSIRLLLNGNTMYVLTTTPPLVYADEKNTNRFFNEFRAKEETATSIIENSSDKLFADLQSKDSATFQQAYDALSEVQFMQRDIPLLMDKSIQQYSKYENIYQSVNEKLLSQVEALLERNSSVGNKARVNDFIRENYKSANKSIDSLRFYLLGMISKNKTSESYQLVKELLVAEKHAADHSYRFFGKLYDSLELTKTLFPDLLNYISDTTMDMAIVSLTKTMLDSNKLTKDILLPVKADLIKLARKHVKSMNSEDYSYRYEIPALIELLGYFKQKDADDAAGAFLKSKEIDIKKSAALTLLKNGKPVAASQLSRIANDLQYRVSLYEELKKINKEKLFPADLRSQVGLAEGYVVNAIYEEDEDETIPELIFIKRIEYNYKGTNRAFYIFRANYEYEMEEGAEVDSTTLQWHSPGVTEGTKNTTTESYLVVAGPFELNKGELMIDEKENISGGWYDDKFDGMKIDYFFRKYIERQLKWEEERKKNE